MSPEEPKSRIERAKDMLFNPKIDIVIPSRAGFRKHFPETPTAWGQEGGGMYGNQPPEKSHSMYKKIFFIAFTFFIVALGILGFSLLGGSTEVSNENIEMTILGKAFIDGGEELPLQVEIVNRNATSLELADLVVIYQKSEQGGEDGQERIRESLGEIKAGETILKEIPIQLFGQEGEQRAIGASLEYRVKGSNAIFVKNTEYLVTLRSTPVTLTLEGPDLTVPNQEVSFDITIVSNSETVLPGMLVRAVYPPDFSFTSADPETSFANNIWAIGDIAPGSEKTITFSGMIKSPPNEERVFKVELGSADSRNEQAIDVVYNSVARPLQVRNAFVDAQLFIDNTSTDSVIASSESRINAEIRYTNTLPVRINDVAIIARLGGDALNPSSVNAGEGFFNSGNNQILWDKNSNPRFAGLEPGATGTLRFSFASTALVRANNSVITKPTLSLSVDIRGTDTTEGSTVREAKAIDAMTVQLNSNLSLALKTLHYGGSIRNIGPMPPKVGQETTYTLVWTIANTANEIREGRISTVLPPYVEWKNVVTPAGQGLTYNPANREIIWDIGTIPAGTGFGSLSKEIAFQVGITPSTSQIGKVPELTKDVVLTGRDVFTGAMLKSTKSAHRTQLLNDISTVGAQGNVTN